MDCLEVDEILETIFSFLTDNDELDLISAERVCRRWSQVVVSRFWWPSLQTTFSSGDHFLTTTMLREGFLPDVEPWKCHDVNRKLFLKIRSAWNENWRSPAVARKENVIRRCTASEFASFKVSCVLPYKDKLFLALERGAIEVWSLDDDDHSTPKFRSRIYAGEEDDEAPGHIPRGYCLDLCQSTLASIDCSRRKVLLFDADEERLVGEVATPLGNLYAVGITSKLLVCLSGWSLVAWEHDLGGQQQFCVRPGLPYIVSDLDRQSEEAALLDLHWMEKNEKFVVTLTCVRAPRNQEEQGEEVNNNVNTSSSICVRRCENLRERSTLVSLVGEGEEISRIKLSSSPDNLLAVLECFKSETRLRVLDVERSGSVVYSLVSNQSPLSLVHLPAQWVGDRLFFRRVPHDTEEDVSLMALDLGDNSVFQIKDFKMRTPNDVLCLSRFRILHLFNKFPPTVLGEVQEFQIVMGVMDFL